MADRDNELALGVLATIAQGFSQAKQSDDQFKLGLLNAELERERLKSAENREDFRFAMQEYQDVKKEYNQKIEKLEAFNVSGVDVTSGGEELLEYSKLRGDERIDAVLKNIDVISSRGDKIDSALKFLNKEKNILDARMPDYAGESGYLNPKEFDRMFKDYTQDETLPSYAGAGLKAEYRKLGTYAQHTNNEMTILKGKINEETTPLNADYKVLKAAFTPEYEEDANEASRLESQEKLAESLGLPLGVYQSMQNVLLTSDPMHAMAEIYTYGMAEGGAEFLETLRTNPITMSLFKNLEDKYSEIVTLQRELDGESFYLSNGEDAIINATDESSVLSVIHNAVQSAPTFDELNSLFEKGAATLGVSVEDLQETYTAKFLDPTSQITKGNINENQEDLSTRDHVVSFYSTEQDDIDLKYEQSDDKTREAEFIDTEKYGKIYIGGIFDELDKITIEGTNVLEVEDYLLSLADKKSPNYNPAQLELIRTMYDSYTLVGPNMFPATHFNYNLADNDDYAKALIAGTTGNFQGIFQQPNMFAGTEPGSPDTGTFFGSFPFVSGVFDKQNQKLWLRNKDGEEILDEQGNRIFAYEYFREKGGNFLKPTLANSMGVGKASFITEGIYLNAYNESMEDSFTKLRKEVDYPGLDYASSASTVGEIYIGANIVQEFGTKAYNIAHKTAKKVARTKMIERIKTIIEDPDTDRNTYNAIMDALVLVKNKDLYPDKEYSDEENLYNLNALLKWTGASNQERVFGYNNTTESVRNRLGLPGRYTISDISLEPELIESNLPSETEQNIEVITALEAIKNYSSAEGQDIYSIMEIYTDLWENLTDTERAEFKDLEDFIKKTPLNL